MVVDTHCSHRYNLKTWNFRGRLVTRGLELKLRWLLDLQFFKGLEKGKYSLFCFSQVFFKIKILVLFFLLFFLLLEFLYQLLRNCGNRFCLSPCQSPFSLTLPHFYTHTHTHCLTRTHAHYFCLPDMHTHSLSLSLNLNQRRRVCRSAEPSLVKATSAAVFGGFGWAEAVVVSVSASKREKTKSEVRNFH